MMDRETQRQLLRQKLVVIPGGLGLEGPFTRLGLRDRFPTLSTRSVAFLMIGKVALLASLCYYFYY